MSDRVRILHLEDNPRDAQLIRELLLSEGLACDITLASNRRDFETAFNAGSFDLIFCDNNLPDTDGATALRFVRKTNPLTPVIILSGSLGEEEAVKSLKIGATDYLLKDRLERLLPAVRRALEEAEERRQLLAAESELRHSEERMRLALAATNDGIWDWDLVTGRMVANETFERMFGSPSEHVDPAGWWYEHTHPEERDEVRTSLGQAVAGAVRFWSKNYCVRRRDGRWAHVHNRVCLAQDASGRVVRLVGAVQDITATIEAENERRALEEQVRQAQKLDAIGTLAGGIAHDFNNILGIILTNADLARLELPDDLPPQHGVRESLQEIITAANRARDLVAQILTFSRRGESRLGLMKVQPIVREALKMLRATIPAMVRIESSIDPNCRSIVGDPTQIHQVIMNLCTNAWHALPERDGVIEVRLDQLEASQAPLGLIPDPTVHHLVRITVRDNGAGMDERTKARIFEPFFTTKPAGKGTGLGLAVVHGIMKAHDGAIEVQSAPGAGTTISLFFPAQEIEPERVTVETTETPRGEGQRLMLVDDDVAMGRAIRRFLEHQGYHVDLFHTPAAAQEAFRETATTYDLVITDFSMPGASGIDLANEIARVRPGLPVLLVTGSVALEDRRSADLKAVLQVLPKPNSPEALAEAVARALESTRVASRGPVGSRVSEPRSSRS